MAYTATQQKKAAPCTLGSKIYLNSRLRLAYRYEHGEFQIYYFTRQEWTRSLRLKYQYDKNNPGHLPPEQWLDWWYKING